MSLTPELGKRGRFAKVSIRKYEKEHYQHINNLAYYGPINERDKNLSMLVVNLK